jgi:hypothetical protein
MPWRHPATLGLAALLGAAIVALIALRIQDMDLWTLLAQGRALWDGHPPTVNHWVWPKFGEPQVAASWAFRGLIWPIWDAADVAGIYAWRWLSALVVFALMAFTARRMGARGVLPFVVLAVCAVIYRDRSDARPESLAAILLSATVLVLEMWRSQGRNLPLVLVPIALVWANAHVSYYLLFALGLFYAFDAHANARFPGRPQPGPLWLALFLALLVSFVNPSGWRTLWQPFEFALNWRSDPMFAAIEELQPYSWGGDWSKGLPVLLLLWPVVMLWRTFSERRADVAEMFACAAMTALAVTSVRFRCAKPSRDPGCAPPSRRHSSSSSPATTSCARNRSAASASTCVSSHRPQWTSWNGTASAGAASTTCSSAAISRIARGPTRHVLRSSPRNPSSARRSREACISKRCADRESGYASTTSCSSTTCFWSGARIPATGSSTCSAPTRPGS